MIGPGNTLIVATRNRGKTKEFREAFAALGVEVRDLNDIGSVPPIEETGLTFAENALLKARTTALSVGLPALADDSGLCVDALDGEPGVYSARYAGEEASDSDNNAKLLRELAAREAAGGLGDVGAGLYSSARFVCALSLYVPDTRENITAEGTAEGFILKQARGAGGFGYDPLFWMPEFGKSMAELTLDEKNAVSHRGVALRRLLTSFKAG